jgi:uncharacterized protein
MTTPKLSLDILTLSVPAIDEARSFYTSTFTLADTSLNLHGAGEVELDAAVSSAARKDFPGLVVSYIVDQPSEVESLLNAAAEHGADILKPAKKGFFGGFTAVFRAPDGAIWKLATDKKKDSGPAAEPPNPSETVCILGVADPKESKAFYTSLGMTVDRDYGKKFIDFEFDAGASRLGLLRRTELAKDAGVDGNGGGAAATMLVSRQQSREDVDALLAAATSAGGKISAQAGAVEGGYAGQFTDLDGFIWKIAAV